MQAKKINYYKNFSSSGTQMKLLTILEAIENGTFQDQIRHLRSLNENEYRELKKKLPHFTPSGTFNNRRSAENLAEYSQIIVLDIDKVGTNAEDIKNKAANVEFTLAAFLSPGGEGVKILVKTDSTAECHEKYFGLIADYYEKILNVEVDRSGKDIARACFVSDDSQLYYNENSEVFEHKISITKVPLFKETTCTVDFENIFEKVIAFTEKKEAYFEGNRNNFIHLLACNCNRYGLEEQKTEELIKSKYKDLSETEIKSTIHSAFKNIEENDSLKYNSTITREPINYSNPNHTGVWNVFDLIERNKKEPQYKFIWKGIKESSFGYIFGPPKVAKTILCENLGMAIAAGHTSYLGFEIDQTRKRKVLFIGMEEFWRNRIERNEKQLTALKDIDTNNFPFQVVDESFPSRFEDEKDWAKLEKIIKDNSPDVVFIDSMTRTVKDIEESNSSRDASIKLRDLVKKYGITLIMIHHTTKLNGSKIDIDKIAGSRVIAQEADFMIGMAKEGNTRYLMDVANRYKAEDENMVEFSISENLWLKRIEDSTEKNFDKKDARRNTAHEQLILDIIIANTSEEEPNVETKKIIEAAEGKIIESEVYRYLKNLESSGKIKRSRGCVSLVQNTQNIQSIQNIQNNKAEWGCLYS